MRRREVIIIGGGMAGLSAAVYLGRARRDTLIIHSGRSMAKWEPDVQNYLGFPEGIAGSELLKRGTDQARRFDVEMIEDDIHGLTRDDEVFCLEGRKARYQAGRVLIATGLTHLPPEIPGVTECLGRSLFFCKDCDAFRVQGQRIIIIGWNNEAVEYALAMLLYSPSVMIATNGKAPVWDGGHATWLEEYRILVRRNRIQTVDHDDGQLHAVTFDSGESLTIDAVFTTRGDVYHSRLAQDVGTSLDDDGQLIVDDGMRTSVPGLYAAGCVTPANCQMIIAAGQGALAAQTMNRDLFEDSLQRHALPMYFDGAVVGGKGIEG